VEKLRKIETTFGFTVKVGAAELADLQRQGLVKTGGADSAVDNAAAAADESEAGE